ncbi:MAG: OmpH family outer membrane protein [Balneolaceae bacterium]
MKRIIPILIFAFFVTTEVIAQNQKIGFFDSEIIMENMPEYSGIEQRLNLLSEGWENEIREIENEIEDLEEDFAAREILFTEEIREARRNEILNLQNQRDNLVQEKFGPEGEYFTSQKDLLEPIQRQIFQALNVVAERENYDFVFDRAEDTRFLYTTQEWNITENIMLELGLDIDSLSN